MKPRFGQTSGAYKSNTHGTQPSARKEGAVNSKNVHQHDGRIFEETSSASGAQAGSFECQCRLNRNEVQDCSQYAKRVDYPFYTGSVNETEERNSTQHHALGQTNWQQSSSGQQVNANQQMIVYQLTNNNQQGGGQQDARVSRQAGYEDHAAKICVPIQQEPGPSSRNQSYHHTSSAAADIPVPQPKVMCVAPYFEGTAVYKGEFRELKLSDYRGRYLCLLFYPLDFTFVCPTEILAMSDLHDQFKEVNCAVLGCSCDSPYSHLAYMKTPRVDNGLGEIAFPLLSDFKKTISDNYNVLTDEGSPERALFIIDPLGIIRSITINDAGVGRNTDEVLRMMQAIKRVDDFGGMCPHGCIADSISVAPTRHPALNYYRQSYIQKTDKKNRKQEEVGACSSHIIHEQEKMDRL